MIRQTCDGLPLFARAFAALSFVLKNQNRYNHAQGRTHRRLTQRLTPVYVSVKFESGSRRGRTRAIDGLTIRTVRGVAEHHRS